MSAHGLSFLPYNRQLAKTLVMSRGRIPDREGIILRLESAEGAVAFSEVLILPYFKTEELNQSLSFLQSLSGSSPAEIYRSVRDDLPATSFALEAAEAILNKTFFTMKKCSKPCSKLISSLKDLPNTGDYSYRTFKSKIGILPIDEELLALKRLCSELPRECSLRLDANGGLSVEQAKRWLEACEDTQVSFIEQPLHPDLLKETIKLSSEFKTQIALDESVSSSKDLVGCHDRGWRGIFVVKPSRLVDLETFFRWREKSKATIVYSSALETSFGTEVGLQIAASDLDNKHALGYGVSHWFNDDGFDIHSPGPTLSSVFSEDRNGGLHKLWNQLNKKFSS